MSLSGRNGIGTKIINNLWVVGAGAGVLAAGLAVAQPQFLHDVVTESLDLDAKVEGQFQSEGNELGTWTLVPTACRSGQRMGFHGVLLGVPDDDEHLVRVARDPATGALVVSARKPGTDQVGVFSGCDLEGELHQTNTSVNEIWGMEGSISIECPDDDFSGQATFSDCY